MRLLGYASLLLGLTYMGGSLAATSTAENIHQQYRFANQAAAASVLNPATMEARRGDERRRYRRGRASRSSYSRSRRYARRSSRRGSFSGRGSMPQQIASKGRVIIVDLCKHKLGAYIDGSLVKSCPISGGARFCPDIGRSCRSPVGSFAVHSKKRMHYSSRYPVERWKPRAAMPNSLFFNGGYAIHATTSYIRGRHESHGCIRTTHSCSNWLFSFARIGTRVRVKPYCGN